MKFDPATEIQQWTKEKLINLTFGEIAEMSLKEMKEAVAFGETLPEYDKRSPERDDYPTEEAWKQALKEYFESDRFKISYIVDCLKERELEPREKELETEKILNGW